MSFDLRHLLVYLCAALLSVAPGFAWASDADECLSLAKEKDFKSAYSKYKQVAEQWGDDADILTAQSCLGAMYHEGKGVIEDQQEAYFWLLLATHGGKEEFHGLKDEAKKYLNLDQISAATDKAKRLPHIWKITDETKHLLHTLKNFAFKVFYQVKDHVITVATALGIAFIVTLAIIILLISASPVARERWREAKDHFSGTLFGKLLSFAIICALIIPSHFQNDIDTFADSVMRFLALVMLILAWPNWKRLHKIRKFFFGKTIMALISSAIILMLGIASYYWSNLYMLVALVMLISFEPPAKDLFVSAWLTAKDQLSLVLRVVWERLCKIKGFLFGSKIRTLISSAAIYILGIAYYFESNIYIFAVPAILILVLPVLRRIKRFCFSTLFSQAISILVISIPISALSGWVLLYFIELTQVFTLIGTILGPLLALLLSIGAYERQQKNQRKIRLFNTLVALKKYDFSLGRAQALNEVKLEFSEPYVENAWVDYVEYMNKPERDRRQKNQETLYNALLKNMATALGDESRDIHHSYAPQAHRNLEKLDVNWKTSLLKTLTGEEPIAFRNSERGEVDALYIRGTRFRDGDGVRKNPKKAIRLFKAAAYKDKDYIKAKIALGEMYLKGEGVEKNERKALYWFEQAAKSGG